MRFEGRDLTTYAEPISATALREGQTYFFVRYVDEHLRVPLVDTVVFAERFVGSDGTELLRFQDVRSYQRGIRFGSPELDGAQFQSATENGINHLFDYEHALDELLRCAIRRNRRSDSV